MVDVPGAFLRGTFFFMHIPFLGVHCPCACTPGSGHTARWRGMERRDGTPKSVVQMVKRGKRGS